MDPQDYQVIYSLGVYITYLTFLIFLVRAMFYYNLSKGQHPSSQKCYKYSKKVGDSILFLQISGLILIFLFFIK